MDYSKFIYKTADSSIPGNQLPPNAIIVQKEVVSKSAGNPSEVNPHKKERTSEDVVFAFRRYNEHGNIFTVPLGGPEGVNEAARQKIQELGLQNERFFFKMGDQDRYFEATQRLV
jgi:hypothetical protein